MNPKIGIQKEYSENYYFKELNENTPVYGLKVKFTGCKCFNVNQESIDAMVEFFRCNGFKIN